LKKSPERTKRNLHKNSRGATTKTPKQKHEKKRPYSTQRRPQTRGLNVGRCSNLLKRRPTETAKCPRKREVGKKKGPQENKRKRSTSTSKNLRVVYTQRGRVGEKVVQDHESWGGRNANGN